MKKKTIIKKANFIDAQEMALKHPETFFAPSVDELNKIKEGSIVKVAVEGERFWARVLFVNGDKIIGEVDNDLIFSNLKYQDKIEFEKRHIYNIFDINDY